MKNAKFISYSQQTYASMIVKLSLHLKWYYPIMPKKKLRGKKDSTGLWIPQHASDGKVYIWTPPPIIADVALEECAKAIHKCTDAYHIFLIPRLYSPLWM